MVDLGADLYYLILQKLKDKAIELQKLIDKNNENTDEAVAGRTKELIKERLLWVMTYELTLSVKHRLQSQIYLFGRGNHKRVINISFESLVQVIPSIGLVRKLLVLSGLYNQAQVGNNINHMLLIIIIKVVSKIKQVEIQTCLFTLHTFDCLVSKHSWDVQQAVRKKVRH